MVLEYSHEKCLSDENFIPYETTSYCTLQCLAFTNTKLTSGDFMILEKIPMAPCTKRKIVSN